MSERRERDKILVTCWACSSQYEVPASAEGRKGKCPKCGVSIQICREPVVQPRPADAPAHVGTGSGGPHAAPGEQRCHFCGRRPGNEKCAIRKTFYSNARKWELPGQMGALLASKLHMDTVVQYKVAWDKREACVPRCPTCAAKHRAVDSWGWICGLSSLALGMLAFLLPFAVLDKNQLNQPVHPVLGIGWAAGMFVVIPAAGVIAWIIARKEVLNGSRKKDDIDTAPQIVELVREGWEKGKPDLSSARDITTDIFMLKIAASPLPESWKAKALSNCKYMVEQGMIPPPSGGVINADDLKG